MKHFNTILEVKLQIFWQDSCMWGLLCPPAYICSGISLTSNMLRRVDPRKVFDDRDPQSIWWQRLNTVICLTGILLPLFVASSKLCEFENDGTGDPAVLSLGDPAVGSKCDSFYIHYRAGHCDHWQHCLNSHHTYAFHLSPTLTQLFLSSLESWQAFLFRCLPKFSIK